MNRCECIIPCGCGTVAGQRSGWGGVVSLNAEPAQVSANPVYEELDQAIRDRGFVTRLSWLVSELVSL